MTVDKNSTSSIEELIFLEPPPSEKRLIRVKKTIKWSCYIIIGLTGAWIPFFAFYLDIWEVSYANIVFIFFAFYILHLTRKNKINLASHVLTISVISWIFAVSLIASEISSNAGGVHYWLFALIVGLHFTMLDNKRFWLTIYMAACLFLFMAIELNYFGIEVTRPQPEMIQTILRSVTMVTIMLTLIFLVNIYIEDIHAAENQLEHANDKMEQLLANILPEKIAGRLRKTGTTFADGFSECSVLFADIVGFTSLSDKKPAEEIVLLLNQVFARFDDLTEKFGAEKIKTIGDAYMVAAGIPDPCLDHASRLAKLAFAFQEAVAEFPGLNIRIGINSGPVVAGVIGRKRFIYDLWGDTVNLASRMESHGVPGSIQVSEETYNLIKDDFNLESRGFIDLKGKGATPTYILLSQK